MRIAGGVWYYPQFRGTFRNKKLSSRTSTSESAHTYLISPEQKTEPSPKLRNDPPPKPKSHPSPKPPTPAPRSLSTAQPEEKKVKSSSQDQAPSTCITGKTQYEAWLQRKKSEERRRKTKQQEEAAKKEAEEKERKENAKKLFERWKHEHDEKERALRQQKKAKEKEKHKTEEASKKERMKEAEKSFEAWKRSHSRPRTSSSNNEAEKQRQKEEAKNEAEKAFEAWKKSKDMAKLARKRVLAEKEEKERKQLEEEREYKELLAQQTYETWLEIKENERLLAQSMNSLNVGEPSLLPWLPPSNTCPRQFRPPPKHRRRSLDRRQRATSAQAARLNREGSVITLFVPSPSGQQFYLVLIVLIMWAIHVFIASIPLITALTFSNGTDFFHEELWDNQWLELNGMMRYKCLPRSTDLTRIWYFEERYVSILLLS
ncbi:hypothetical protein RB195_002003 [Necator americanus]|uniref:Uncharacterized protein n=1 Tax=Necator americanus TaxID=51031 RepID=A0ABR1DHQ3_NECAM